MGVTTEAWHGITKPMQSHVNIGTGSDCSIEALARSIANVVGFDGEIEFDHDKPDGTPRKLLDITRISQIGWRPRISLEDGLRDTYEWFKAHQHDVRR